MMHSGRNYAPEIGVTSVTNRNSKPNHLRLKRFSSTTTTTTTRSTVTETETQSRMYPFKQVPKRTKLVRKKEVNFNLNKMIHSMNQLTSILIFGSLISVSLMSISKPVDAFQYDIWFKFPHPYTQTVPISYCPESVASQSKGACQSALPIYVNTLDSPKTFIPYSIEQILDFCPLTEAREFEYSSHTEWDDSIKLAPFDIKFGRNEECKVLCKKSYKMNSHSDLYKLEELKIGLTRDYYHHWFADTFPFAWCYRSPPTNDLNNVGIPSLAGNTNTNPKGRECFIGFPIGYSTDSRGMPEDERIPIGNFTKPNTLFLFNHFDFTFLYETGEGKAWSRKLGQQASRITGIRVQPRSINHEQALGPEGGQQQPTNGQQSTNSRCSYSMHPQEIPSFYQYGTNASLQISYTYSVKFVEDENSALWHDRWARLEVTLPGTGKADWILAGCFILLILTTVPALYALAKTILSDRVLMGLNPREESDDLAWKQLAGDIFREPNHIALFSVLVGSGTQFIASLLLSELFSLFVSLFSTTLLVIFVVLFVLVHGFLGGYAAIRLYRTFGGEEWRTVCLFVTSLNPMVLFCLMVMTRNLLLLYNGSSLAINVGLFGSIFMTALCFALSVPSALAGGSVAFKKSAIEFPVRPTANKRQLGEHQIWRQPLTTTLAVGLIPYLCICAVEAYPFYDAGGLIITVITIFILVSLSISHCYFHLSQYDYRWWWRSYMACAIAAIYHLIHWTYYITTTLYIDNMTNALLYLGFAFLMRLALFLLTGTIGFMVTFAFLWHIYKKAAGAPGMTYAMFQKNTQIE